jgi:hypothetical protein
MSIEFVDPPPPRTAGRKPTVMTPAIREAVRERPNQWAKPWAAVPKSVQSVVMQYCNRHPEYEATSRVVDDGRAGAFDVYLRYVGEDA